VPVAVLQGQDDGHPGIWNPYAWGQYNNGTEWETSDAESKRPVRYMSGGRTNADRKLKNYFEAGFQNGGSRIASPKTQEL